ncbi:MAG: NHL repeat-containing protein [Thermodesulfobacteriota bacterium]
MKTLFRKLVHHSMIPLFHSSIPILLSIGILLLSLNSFSAETVKLKYLQSVYFDDKGGGLKQPEAVASGEKSVLVVGDTANDRLVQYTFQDKNLAGGSQIKIPQLSNPIRVQVNSKREIFALDGKKRRIVRLSPEGTFKNYVDPEGIPSPSAFVSRSFKIDRSDNIYILDIFTGRVLVLNPEGKYQKQIPFPKEYGFFSDLSVDSKGNILLLDCVKAMVFSAPKDANSFSPLTKSLREYLDFPTSLSESRGTIYVVDEDGGGIVILGADGTFVGRQLSKGWNEGLLYFPSQISVNEKGEIFIADRGNSRVQIFTLMK